MSAVIQVEHLSKSYRLGAIGGGTLREDVSRWLAKLRGKEDPTLKVGQEHHARLMGKEFWALQDVSFEVKQGEILGVIGRNGAGKSTLLKILSRVTAPTSGEVRVKGRIASLLEVGTGFHPELSGRENIFLNGAILGMSKAEIRKKFDEIVAFSEVEDFIDTPVKRYSSGMYVRLAFAVAAHLEPEILVVDEVLAVGDVAFQKKCLGKMHNVAREGRTILFVSHNLAAVHQLCSCGIVLSAGSLMHSGSCESAIQLYQSLMPQKSVLRGQRQGTGFSDVLIVDREGNQTSSVTAKDEVFLRLWIQNETQRQLQVGFTIFSQMDVPLISSAGNDSNIKVDPGRHGYEIRLPIELFAAGHYRVEGAVWDAHEIHHQDDCLCEFEVISGSGHEAAGNAYRSQIVLRHPWKTLF
jgi:lipopolysaccharide transport system ATP-binding protein